MLATLKTVRTLALYEGAVVPWARREIGRWAESAAGISDPSRRRRAAAAIAIDASNAEAAAAFAAFAPRTLRRVTTELLVSWQVLIDYVDALGEQAEDDPLAYGQAIGTALAASVDGAPSPAIDDEGHLGALVTVCNRRLDRLPAASAVVRAAADAAVRCSEALAQTHAAANSGDTGPLQRWAQRQHQPTPYAWWEISAGGNSNVAVLALLAAAADPLTTVREAEAVAGAYWPHVCVLSTLLDSLVDYERDRESGNFSFVSHYPDEAAVEAGLVGAARRSLAAVEGLRDSHTHAMIVCGVAAFYATAAEPGSLAARVAPAVVDALRPTATPIALALRMQRRIGGGRKKTHLSPFLD